MLSVGDKTAATSQKLIAKISTPKTVILASTETAVINIQSQFYSQAPLGNWSDPWDNACEEASALIIANTYYKHNWTKEQFADQILKMVEWEKQNLGLHKDTNAAQTTAILKEYLNLETITHQDPTLEQIKGILDKGHMIIGFFAGKTLGNPNYINGGPNYHVIVIKGYTTDNKIITHDVGTNFGADYIYDWTTIQTAMHDLATPIEAGAKKIIEVIPPEK